MLMDYMAMGYELYGYMFRVLSFSVCIWLFFNLSFTI
jgi:hypothetical protein